MDVLILYNVYLFCGILFPLYVKLVMTKKKKTNPNYGFSSILTKERFFEGIYK